MPTDVRFRFNLVTGEVEEFTVDDHDRGLPEAEHDRRANAVGSMVAAHARIVPLLQPSAQASSTPGRTKEEEVSEEASEPAEPERDT